MSVRPIVTRDQTKRQAPAELYAQPRWYACYTRARQEKKVEALFEHQGIRSYLPLVPLLRQWHDRRKIIRWPLFDSYIFAHFSLNSLSHVLSTPGLSTVVRSNGWPAPISDEEIANMARFVEALAPTGLQPKQVPLAGGQRVRIISGPFKGVTGIVLEIRGRKRVLIGLQTIGVGFEVDIGAVDMIAKIVPEVSDSVMNMIDPPPCKSR